MNYKRFNKARNWNPTARYSLHDRDGLLLEGDSVHANRWQAKAVLSAAPESTWIKDNINTYFVYVKRMGRIVRMRTELAGKLYPDTGKYIS